ncbi:MAG: chloramphenicol acetyltransferase [Bacteroidales bacterium]
MKRINLDRWARKDQYLFFKDFDEPFFGIAVEVDCTETVRHAKETGISLFLSYLHKSLEAANRVEEFRYRIVQGEVMLYEEVHASAVIDRPNGTFGFSYIDFHPDFETFRQGAEEEIRRVQQSTGLQAAVSGENVIHYSSIPWIRFTSLSHARHYAYRDSCPKISFGKITPVNGKHLMPLSIHGHHALMDGRHVGQCIDEFQKLLNNPV